MDTLFDLHGYEHAPAEARKVLGMTRATAHADATHEGWSNLALAFLVAYARQHEVFVGFEVTHAARVSQVVPEASGKAWGSVFTTAARLGYIRKTGEYLADPHRHLNPAPCWRSLIYHQEASDADPRQ